MKGSDREIREEARSQKERKKGEGGSRKDQEAFNGPGAMVIHSTAHLVGTWSRSGKDGNIVNITGGAGYGGVFTVVGSEHPNLVTAVKS